MLVANAIGIPAPPRPRQIPRGSRLVARRVSKPCRYPYASSPSDVLRFRLTLARVRTHTTKVFGAPIAASLRRRGNADYLVRDVRRGGKVKPLHLASLGERPRTSNPPRLPVPRRRARNLRVFHLPLPAPAPLRPGAGAGALRAGDPAALLLLLLFAMDFRLLRFDPASTAPASNISFRTGG